MKQNKRYISEFKAQAVELLATGKPVQELAEELRISASLLYSGRAAAPAPGTRLSSSPILFNSVFDLI